MMMKNTKRGLLLGLTLAVMQTVILHSATGSEEDNMILDRYRPVAMDESVTIEKDGRSYLVRKDRKLMGDRSRIDGLRIDGSRSSLSSDSIEVKPHDGRPIVIEPRNVDSSLTKLIANRGRDPPTLALNKLSMPKEMEPGTKDADGNEILASYSIMLPIFVPAVRRKIDHPTPKAPVKIVKEIKTEMVPVKVPQEIIEVEKVPMEVNTNYVSLEGRTLPPKINGVVLPDDQVVSTTVNVLD